MESYLKSTDKIFNFFYEINSSVDIYIVVYRDVPRQRRSNDCGLFCFLISLCQGLGINIFKNNWSILVKNSKVLSLLSCILNKKK